ncbi:hypothetical protein D3C85_1823560 [compost metagenome]
MHGPDAGAGQHGYRSFRYHRHIDSHDVAFFNAQLFQHVGELADIVVQLFVGHFF